MRSRPTRAGLAVAATAALVGGGVGAGTALLLDDDRAGPRGPTGPRGERGPAGPPGISADIGVLEARLAGLERRLSKLEEEVGTTSR